VEFEPPDSADVDVADTASEGPAGGPGTFDPLPHHAAEATREPQQYEAQSDEQHRGRNGGNHGDGADLPLAHDRIMIPGTTRRRAVRALFGLAGRPCGSRLAYLGAAAARYREHP
jgi:hypothetical protein